ncbi:MAG: hypothetical protein IPL52_13395 [Flavobacteriales bacterium]|nr:hypothetical protein [Flavobacteriales bacterium]
MTTASKKALIKKLVDSEKDAAVLDLVDNVLQRRTRGVAFQSDLVKRVLRSERSVKAGNLIPWEVVSGELDTLIDGLYAVPAKSAKRATKARRKA